MAKTGRPKCKRCKTRFDREKGSTSELCLTCLRYCRRCGVEQFEPQIKMCMDCEIIQKGYTTSDKARDNRLINIYGITLDEYEEMLKAQNKACWICERNPTGNRLHVDHLHSKGEKHRDGREKRGRIRGLLCWQCNVAIAKFRDDITRIRKAADYLDQWPAQAILKKEKPDE